MVNLFIPVTILALCLIPGGLGANQTQLPCPLVWTAVTLGDYPPDVISFSTKNSSETLYIVGRSADSSDEKYATGYVDTVTGFGYFAIGGTENMSTSYEVLTNPHGCEIDWLPEVEKEFAVQTKDGQSPETFVGRGFIDIVVKPGDIRVVEGTDTKVYMTNAGREVASTDFQFLTSYSKGLTCKAVNFEFEDSDNVIRPEMVGIDEIFNESPAIVVQVLTHRTKVKERKTVTTSSYSKSTFGFSVGVTAGIPLGGPKLEVGISYGYNKASGEESSNTSVYEEERELSFVREIRLPPFVSAQACSLVSMLEDAILQFNGELHYSAPGIDLAAVKKILDDEGIVGGTIDEVKGVVVVKTSGEFGATMALNTEFIVLPLDKFTGGEGGCSAIQQRSREIQEIMQGLKDTLYITSSDKKDRIKQLLREIREISSKRIPYL